MIEAGLTPMQVIVGSTKYPAEMLRKGNLLGTVEAGKLADVIVVDADPLRDIKNLDKINSVIQDGKIVELGYHANCGIARHPSLQNYHQSGVRREHGPNLGHRSRHTAEVHARELRCFPWRVLRPRALRERSHRDCQDRKRQKRAETPTA